MHVAHHPARVLRVVLGGVMRLQREQHDEADRVDEHARREDPRAPRLRSPRPVRPDRDRHRQHQRPEGSGVEAGRARERTVDPVALLDEDHPEPAEREVLLEEGEARLLAVLDEPAVADLRDHRGPREHGKAEPGAPVLPLLQQHGKRHHARERADEEEAHLLRDHEEGHPRDEEERGPRASERLKAHEEVDRERRRVRARVVEDDLLLPRECDEDRAPRGEPALSCADDPDRRAREDPGERPAAGRERRELREMHREAGERADAHDDEARAPVIVERRVAHEDVANGKTALDPVRVVEPERGVDPAEDARRLLRERQVIRVRGVPHREVEDEQVQRD